MGTGGPWQCQNQGAVIGYVAADVLKASETTTVPLSSCSDPAVKQQMMYIVFLNLIIATVSAPFVFFCFCGFDLSGSNNSLLLLTICYVLPERCAKKTPR